MSATWMTPSFSWIPVSGHWNDILPCGDCSQITMFVQLCKHKGVIPARDAGIQLSYFNKNTTF
ncbi:hypothetical protein [Wolbachia endosymbiont (group A) of Lasioglossum morio]|uniref:hypothetical protein n=1 Tax=Wolbachia endosymbiont (group A) of Lasioglossum morio TaxID=2954025 RepID=UPI002227CB63|nr:hypothetical protein [Wolbachia endosymbiont (group A) of Lasioglossum morio]